MRGELARAREAPRFRAIADALKLLGDQKPPVEVELADGEHARVPSKPGESAGDVAERLYAAARSMERALESLPARMLALSHETERSAATVGAQATRHAERPDASEEGPSRSYRSYRSTTGLEIRVGRGARANEELTFRESSPNDIWLHARESAGAHVVLRWTSAESPPPSALEEAAILAALHSKSRGAALVPVDWTRRKYVRRARGAPPGTVLVQRARTMMVKPDPLLEKKLRAR
jgi:predicted ribosome quality control (RQC) complex YloA/Tae2 family protein